jgi:hypothetical protein
VDGNASKAQPAEGSRPSRPHRVRQAVPGHAALLDNPADRLSVMDHQGVEACVNYAAIATE